MAWASLRFAQGQALARPRLRAGFPAHPAHIILMIYLFASPLVGAFLNARFFDRILQQA